MKNYEDLKNSVFDFFDSNRRKNYSLEELINIFSIEDNEIEIFKKCLYDLQIKEKIIYLNNKYMIFPFNSSYHVSKLKHKDNSLFYINNSNRIIYLDEKELNGAIKNDYILYDIKKEYNGKEHVIVKSIISNNHNIILDCVLEEGILKLKSSDNSFNYNLELDNESIKKLFFGARYLVKLTDFNNNTYKASIVDYIGHKDDPDFFVKTIASKLNISIDYPKSVLNEVNNIKTYVDSSDLKNRVDYRDKCIFTIDGKNTKDMDDAISLEKNYKGNYVLGVYIADVSYYVKENSSIFNDAKKRGNSYYPANFVIPMLHHILSNGICSLNEGVDRLTLSCIMEIDPTGELIDYKIEESVINSKKKMSYEDVNQVLDGINVTGYEKFYDTLKLMEKLHYILDNKKKKRGYISFGNNDLEASINDNIINIKEPKRDKAEKLIEDFMLLANNTIASHIYNIGLPFLYRCHDLPDSNKLKEAIDELNQMGYKVNIRKSLTNNYCLQDILSQLEKYEEYPILSERILQSMKRAIYSYNNKGHFGLALKTYTHFTSPIRRFIDLEVHTLLKKYNNGNLPEDYDLLIDELNEIARHCNETSRLSSELEQQVNTILIKEYLEQNYDKVYNALVCSITNSYITIKLDEGIYGKIDISDLDKKYKFDSKNKCLYNKHNEIKQGNKIEVTYKGYDNNKAKFTSPTLPLSRVKK